MLFVRAWARAGSASQTDWAWISKNGFKPEYEIILR